ncbi:MAG: histidine phosphatase family protein [Herbiconiux sp.]|nr:histidine phosphatase family protein [Herbiconiux sp.]
MTAPAAAPALRLHLVRHAETLFNVRHQLQGWCDSPLTPRGERQAAALGEHFASVPLVAAFSSDLTRTRRTTAGALAAHPQLSPEWLPSLREWNFGGWEGQPNPALWEPLFASRGYRYGEAGHWDALTSEGPDAVLDLIAALDPSGLAENAAAVAVRMRAAVARLTAIPSGDVLVVTHGAVLQSLVPLLVPGARIAPGYPNCGITTVTLPRLAVPEGAAALAAVPSALAAAAAATPTLGLLDPSCSLPDDAEPLTLP